MNDKKLNYKEEVGCNVSIPKALGSISYELYPYFKELLR